MCECCLACPPHLGCNNEESGLWRELPCDLSQVSAIDVGDIVHSRATLTVGLEGFGHHERSLQ